MAKSRIFLYSCFLFLASVFFYDFISMPQNLVLGFLLFSFFSFFFIFLFIKKKSRFIKIVLSFFIFLFAFNSGFFLRGRASERINDSIIRRKAGEKVKFRAIVKRVDKEANKINLTLEIKDRAEEGKVLVTANRFPGFEYGDELQIRGTLQKPPVFKDFNYRKFLEKEGIYGTMYYPKINLINKDKGNFIYSKILILKNKFREVIYTNLSPPHSIILGAILLGDKNKIGGKLGEKLNIAGVRHITAISGMHIFILVLIIGGFLKSKKYGFLILFIFLIFFLGMIGFPASAVRASVMILLIKFSSLVGRRKNPFRSLTLAATGMVVFNPLLLKYSLGFQLSFLAVIGISYFSPFLKEKLNFVPNILKIREILAVTLSAQAFVFPLLLFKMGSASAISPLANILIVPLIPLILGSGFIFILIGAVFPLLGKILSFFVYILIDYVIKVVNFSSQFDFFVVRYSIPSFLLVIIYGLLIYFIFKLNKKEPLAFYPY